MAEVEIYTQPFCPYCSRALRLLHSKNVRLREIDAPYGSDAREEAVRRSGGRTTVPQIFIDGRHVGGSDELAALEVAGELDDLLRAA